MIANIQLNGVPIASSPDSGLRPDQGATQHCILNLATRFDDAFRDFAVCDLAICPNGRMRADDRMPYFGGWMDKRRCNDFHTIMCFIDGLIGFALVE